MTQTSRPRRSREEAGKSDPYRSQIKTASFTPTPKSENVQNKRLILSKNYMLEIKVSEDSVYKITPRCELLDTGRSLRLPSTGSSSMPKVVILSGPAAIHEETDVRSEGPLRSPDYLFICLPANTTISSTRRFISSTTFSNIRLRDTEING